MKYLIDFAALALLYVFAFFPRWRKMGRDRLLVNTLMYAYCTAVLYFTLMPVLCALPYLLDHPYTPMNLVPFIDVSLGRGDYLRQIVLNVLLTVPFGFLYPLTRNGAAKCGQTVLLSLLMSLGIELLQPLLNGGRSSDITDLITNGTGGLLGYGLYVLFRPVTDRILNFLRKNQAP